MKHSYAYILATLALGIAGLSSAALAGELDIPNTFSTGTRAVAAEVNDNFAAVDAAVDDNDARITSNTTSIADNAALIDTNVSVIGDNSNAISAIATSQGVAFAESVNDSRFVSDGTPTLVKTLTISAPQDGFVVANLGGVMICTSGARCALRCSLSDGPSNQINFTHFTLASTIREGTDSTHEGIGLTTALAVPAGDTVLNAVCQGFESTASVVDMAITAVYSTNRY